MSGLSQLFIPPDSIESGGDGFVQLLFLMGSYGYILYWASNLIAEGSELLMLVLNPGLIGGLVLPVMGAVPDGAIVLFSGLGPGAQSKLKVGLGTLAGSTIMLLTVPWCICQFMGRVDLDAVTGRAIYGRRAGKSKLENGASLTETGVRPTKEIPANAKIMLLTAIAYVIIQGPAFFYDGTAGAARKESGWALAGFIVSIIAFLGYSAYQVLSASALEQQEAKLDAVRKKLFNQNVHVSVLTLLGEVAVESAATTEEGAQMKRRLTQKLLTKDAGAEISEGERDNIRPLLETLYKQYDIDGDNGLDKYEVRYMLKDSLKMSHMQEIPMSEVTDLFRKYDKDSNGSISFEEFELLFWDYLDHFLADKKSGIDSRRASASRTTLPAIADEEVGEGGDGSASGGVPSSKTKVSHFSRRRTINSRRQDFSKSMQELEEEDGEEDEEEESHMTRSQIWTKSAFLLVFGVGLVTLFSDPMVDVLTALATRLDIPVFYVSFIVTPLVSNASELISSMVFAAKKTRSSITMTFSALLGAATMNNTFCLGIFLALVYFKGLMWEFSAEVLSILVVEIVMAVIAIRTRTYPTWMGLVVGSLFPLSIAFVYILENVAGLD